MLQGQKLGYINRCKLASSQNWDDYWTKFVLAKLDFSESIRRKKPNGLCKWSKKKRFVSNSIQILNNTVLISCSAGCSFAPWLLACSREPMEKLNFLLARIKHCVCVSRRFQNALKMLALMTEKCNKLRQELALNCPASHIKLSDKELVPDIIISGNAIGKTVQIVSSIIARSYSNCMCSHKPWSWCGAAMKRY